VALPMLRVGELVARDLEIYVEEEDVRPDILSPADLGVAWYVVDPPAGKLYLPVGRSERDDARAKP